MTVRKEIGWILIIVMLLTICIVPISAVFAEGEQSSNTDNIDSNRYTPNSQTYMTDNGEHNIYWAQGIDAPLMTSDESQFGKDGYFEKNTHHGYEVYEYPMQDNRGYYDLNKIETNNHCYLVAAANLIHWWLEQNTSYITTYLTNLKLGTIYEQPKGLKPLYPFNNYNIWNKIMTKPTLEVLSIGNIERRITAMIKSPLVMNTLNKYVAREPGYMTDLVWDYFFNGYTAIKDNNEQNIEAEYVMDSSGGYFYPIFGREKITKRYDTGNYDFYKNNLAKLLNSGHGIEMSFFAASNAHAITIWGAEYNEQGDLIRVYYTDSDDYDEVNNDSMPVVYGMRSYNVHSINDAIYLSSNTDPNADAGGFVYQICTLDLAQDRWEERLADTTAPTKPIIDSEPQDYTITPNDTITLSVTSHIEDTGYITYQWYVTDDVNIEGTPINGANKTKYTPPTKDVGTKYYYVNITNNKNGKTTVSKSRYSKLKVDDTLVNAKAPVITAFNTYGVTINQYSTPPELKVSANSPDGGTLSYQWYGKYGMVDSTAQGGTPIKGATKDTFYPPTDKPGRASYYCIVTNTNDTVSGRKSTSMATKYAKTITVNEVSQIVDAALPLISEHPIGANYNVGDKAVALRVNASSIDNGTLSYQWYRINSADDKPELITNATENTYTPNTENKGTYIYYCVVTNTNLSASNSKTKSIETNRATVTVEEVIVESGDNYLASLAVDGYIMSPTFSKDILSYTLTVPYNVDSITITASLADNKASMTGAGKHELVVGDNELFIDVTAENGALRQYKIAVNREQKVLSSNNNLSSLEIVGESIVFDKNITTYTVRVSHATKSITINATAEHNNAIINGIGQHNLAFGDNTIDILVTAENGTKRTYTINVNRNETHVFGEYVVVKEATATEEGLMERVCECGAKETKVIPRLEVEPEENVTPPPSINNSDNSSKNTALKIGLGVGIPTSIILIIVIVVIIIKRR